MKSAGPLLTLGDALFTVVLFDTQIKSPLRTQLTD